MEVQQASMLCYGNYTTWATYYALSTKWGIFFAITNQNEVEYRKVFSYGKHQEETRYNDINVQINDTIIGSVMKTIKKACVIVQREKKSSLWRRLTFAFQLQTWKWLDNFHSLQWLTVWDNSRCDPRSKITRGVESADNRVTYA